MSEKLLEDELQRRINQKWRDIHRMFPSMPPQVIASEIETEILGLDNCKFKRKLLKKILREHL